MNDLRRFRRLAMSALLCTTALGFSACGPAENPAVADPSATEAELGGMRTRIGMASPANEWDMRLGQTGKIDARRFYGDLGQADHVLAMARSELAAGRMPVVSFKIPGNDWAGAAAGRYDGQLKTLAGNLAALPGRVFVAIHHEPQGDGTPADFAAMQRHVLPLLSPPSNVVAGVIANGFWWSAQGQGISDAEIAQWLPADVLRLAEVVAADTYQGGLTANPGEDAGVKIRRLSEWANRVGVNRLGIGEYNGLDAASITAAGNAILADPRFAFACIFNSSQNNRPGVNWTLTGDRLAAFKDTVTRSRR